MDAITSALLHKALEGLHQRYLSTANNIANANSPDYQPGRVRFEDALRTAEREGADAIRAVEPERFVEETNGAAMRLDLELLTASQTASRYRALSDLLSRQMALHRLVVTSGR